jgi:4-hydroxy-2-oxoheptanedioate aldolase
LKNIKNRIKKGEMLLGCWLNLGSSISAEIIGLSGFDWVLIDFEHGSGGEKEVLHQLQALEHTPAATMVRVESYERQRFHRVLDMGAEGVMCPRIKTVGEAEKAARALKYQPEGERGVAALIRANQYGKNFKEYFEWSRKNLVGILQIETTEILDNLDEVAAMEGIDVLFIGPRDLSTALGIQNELEHPKFINVINATIKAVQKHGKAAGILLSSPEEFRKYYERGFRFIAIGSDMGFVSTSARLVVDRVKKEINKEH